MKFRNQGEKQFKAIILAAGTGSRLGMNMPKSLVKLNDSLTILDHQLKNLLQFLQFENISIITGYKFEQIASRYPGLKSLVNVDYLSTNTSKSLLLGLDTISVNNDVIFLNGDVVFDSEIIRLILQNGDSNLICVNNNKVGDEEIKYNIDDTGYIREISKKVINPLGEAVGINYLLSESVPTLIKCLDICKDSDYFEKGIEYAIEQDVNFMPLNIRNRFCIEIDFEEDLNKAKKYLETPNQSEGNNTI